jgi:hypothetical protein
MLDLVTAACAVATPLDVALLKVVAPGAALVAGAGAAVLEPPPPALDWLDELEPQAVINTAAATAHVAPMRRDTRGEIVLGVRCTLELDKSPLLVEVRRASRRSNNSP